MAPVLILIGFMGTGKTVVGRKVAGKQGWTFFDTDEEVEASMGMTIPEAFARKGERFFREVEEKTIIDLLDRQAESGEGMVLSLGGGAVTIDRIRERLARESLVVLLDESVDAAFFRVRNTPRPLAKDRESFGKLFGERSHLYKQVACHTIDTREKNIGAVAEEVLSLVRETIRNGEE